MKFLSSGGQNAFILYWPVIFQVLRIIPFHLPLLFSTPPSSELFSAPFADDNVPTRRDPHAWLHPSIILTFFFIIFERKFIRIMDK